MKKPSTTNISAAQTRGSKNAQTRGFKKALILSGVAVIALTSPAYAGFQWKGPLEAPAPAAAPAPQADAGMNGLEPVTSWNGQTTMAPPAPPAPPAAPPAAPMAAPAAPVPPVQATPVAAPADASDILNGFGSGVPLVMALQQIVPPGYQYSFSSGVNPGTSVSWQGGKPWQSVLGDMLATQNLGYRVQNNIVVVGDFPMPAATPAAAPAPAADTAAAPLVMTPETKADQIPSDMVGDKAAAPAAADQKPVDIRREKPKKTFWQRLTGSGDDDSANAQGDNTNAQPERTANDGAAASDTANSATNSADVRAMNAARAMTGNDSAAAPAAAADDMSAPPADVAHPAVNSMADQAMAGAAVSSQAPEGNSDWGTPAASTSADVPAATAAAPAMPAVAPTPVTSAPAPAAAAPTPPVMPAPSAADEQHAVNLTAPDSSAADSSSAAPMTTASAAKPAATDAAPVTSGMKGDWAAKKGDTLRDVLKSWSDKAGVQLYWSIDYNYRLSSNIDYTGAYDDAVGKLLDQFSAVRPQPYGQLHQSSDGPRVLVVKSYDLTQ